MAKIEIDLPAGWELYRVGVRKYDADSRERYYQAEETRCGDGFVFGSVHRRAGEGEDGYVDLDSGVLGGLHESIAFCEAAISAPASSTAGARNVDANGAEVES